MITRCDDLLDDWPIYLDLIFFVMTKLPLNTDVMLVVVLLVKSLNLKIFENYTECPKHHHLHHT